MDKNKIRSRMQKTIDTVIKDLAKVRTSTATPALVENVMVDYYGTPTPINHVANVTVPEPRTLSIAPFEKKFLPAIEKAILACNLGITPQSDGHCIRLTMPVLTQDRRKELAKQARSIGEDGKVGIRNIRRDENEHLKNEAKDRSESEDQVKGYLDEVQHITDSHIVEIDRIVAEKEKNILTL